MHSQNLRRQAEVLSKQERLFAPRPANWLSWEDANRARVAAVEKLNACTDGAQRPKLIRDCLVLAFHTLQPPDRVGVVVRALLALCLRPACTLLAPCSCPPSRLPLTPAAAAALAAPPPLRRLAV